MRNFLLNNADRYMEAMDRGSRIMGWIAIVLAVLVILIPTIITLWR